MRQKKSKNRAFDPKGTSERQNSAAKGGRQPHVQQSQKRHFETQKSPPSPAFKNAKKGLVIFGQHAVQSALGNPARKIHTIFATDRQAAKLAELKQTTPSLFHAQHHARLDALEILNRDQFNALCSSSASSEPVHQGLAIHTEPLEEVFLSDILAQIELSEDASARIMVLDQVTDPRNIGAIMRSAQAFGAKAIVMTRKHAPLETAALAKTAAGALETVPLVREINLARALDALKDAGFLIAGLDALGQDSLEGLGGVSHLALVMGAEAGGMRRLTMQACDKLVSISMHPDAESLNVSVAAAIALYATRSKQGD